MFFYLVSLFCLVVILPKSAVCNCVTGQVVQHGNSVTLTFNLLDVPSNLIQVNHEVNADERSILVGKKGHANLLKGDTQKSLEILVNSIEELSFKLNVSKNDLGKYCVVDDITKKRASSCCIELFITDMPVVSLHPPPHHPVLRFAGKRNKMSITCKAESTTKPDDHNLPMVYTWFKNGVYYGNGNILHDNHVDITYEGDSIVCVATDDPDCKTVLHDLTSASTINVEDCMGDCSTVDCEGDCMGYCNPVDCMDGPYSIKLQPARGDISTIVGSDLSVDCTSDCNPPCNIRWYKDGDVLDNNKQLNIPDLQVDDDGVYMCIVNNTYGNRNISFNVNFERQEGPPNESPTKQPNEPLNKPPSEPPSEPPNDDNIIWVLYIGVPVFIITMIIVILTILFTYNKKHKAATPIPQISDMVVADWPQPEDSMGYVFTNRMYRGGSNN